MSVCRTVVGDELCSLTYFTEDEVAKVYLREDLEWGADLVGFTENERQGFRSQPVYDGSELGEYVATIRTFEGGYLTRVEGDEGAYVTTGRITIDRFEELVAALNELLEDR